MQHLEEREQMAFFRWVMLCEKADPQFELVFSVPNGGALTRTQIVRRGRPAWIPLQAQRMKAAGMRSGVPDVCLPVARQGYAGLWIEFKSPTGKESDEQIAWHRRLRKENHLVLSPCRTWGDAAGIVCWYLSIPNGSFNVQQLRDELITRTERERGGQG